MILRCSPKVVAAKVEVPVLGGEKCYCRICVQGILIYSTLRARTGRGILGETKADTALAKLRIEVEPWGGRERVIADATEAVGGKSRISDEETEVPDHGIAPVKCQRILKPDHVRDAGIRKDGAAIIATI